MLAPYIQSLNNIFQTDNPSRSFEEKEKLGDLATEIVLKETEDLILDSLQNQEGQSFKRELDKATSSGDSQKELLILVRYLMKIPDVKYRLDARMKAKIAGVQYNLLKK